MYKYKMHQIVQIQLSTQIAGIGRVVGCATNDQPVIDRTYMVWMMDPASAGINPEDYPFPCLAVPECCMKPWEDFIGCPEHLRDVHTEHCCALHGCKYGYEGPDSPCSVVTGRKPQNHLCESCNDPSYYAEGAS